ncbi:MAG: ribonuclease III [Planctomycetaceae bacterium]|jgi:ribonuclease-3|nr:ribonuclease III [Planctomycetaceae bacterium]
MDLVVFLANCQDKIGYKFNDQAILRTALTHSSGADMPELSNERMEFLGDSVLGHVICEYLFRTFPKMLEGEMTKIKSSVVSRSSCHKVALEIGLDKFLIVGRGLSRVSHLPNSIFANAMESLIAAIFLDGGLESARTFILKTFQNEIEIMVADCNANNYKSTLQTHSQKILGCIPEYILLEIKGPEHFKSFHVSVKIGKKTFPSAWGSTKKEAEQRAAENTLSVLQGELPPYLDNSTINNNKNTKDKR